MQETIDAGMEIERLKDQVDAAKQELQTYRQRLQWQLELAALVHRSLLPEPVHHERLSVDVRYLPIEQVGGDYCQVRFADWDTCYIAICDVTGHGIGAALLATRVSSEVRHGIIYGRPPRDIVRALNRFVCDNFEAAGLYLSFVVAQIDLAQRRLTYSGAGHPSQLLVRRDGLSVQPLPSQNMLVGVRRDILDEEPEHTIDLEPGDRLLFYTDGLTESLDAEGRQLGVAGLAEIAAEAMAVELFEMADHVLDRVTRHNWGPAEDDKTLIVAEVR